ncbi:MAG: hypothetical protein IJ958_03745 [Agathobacter sp.]|nr:hypothetical protein [Agathobacter sp.]
MNEIKVSLPPELEKEIEQLETKYSSEISKEEICKILLQLGLEKARENGM